MSIEFKYDKITVYCLIKVLTYSIFQDLIMMKCLGNDDSCSAYEIEDEYLITITDIHHFYIRYPRRFYKCDFGNIG